MIKETTLYSEWLRNWINIYKKPYIKTWKRIKNTIRLHIPESVRKTRMCDLTALQIQKAINDIKSSRMALEAFDVYHGSLAMAYRHEVIKKDIAQLLIKPKHKRKIGSALTSEELNSFLQAIKGHRYEKYYLFCLYTGCRRQEALDVLITDIYPIQELLHIKGTKTDGSERYIPLFPEIKELIDFRIYRPFPFSASRLSKEFKRLCPNHKLHDLRHTFATRCLECGISMKVVQGWLGHARLDTTASIYSHVLPEFEKNEAKKFRLT